MNGTPNQFAPASGDASTGGRGQSVDGIPCGAMNDNGYHVHAFLGVLVNGKPMAIPATIGMYEPGAGSNGWYSTAKCFYEIHTHDSSGYIHMEVAPTTPKTPLSDSLFTLGNVLDIWGQTLTTTRFANFSGPVHIFYATTSLGNIDGGSYVAYTGTTPKSIRMYSHEAIWIEVGTYVPASKLPRVIFYTQY